MVINIDECRGVSDINNRDINNRFSESIIYLWLVTLIAVATHHNISAAELESRGSSHADNASMDSDATQAGVMSSIPEDAVLSGIIERKRRFYADTFPDLQFIVLEGGESSSEELAELSVMLGNEPVSLDYEHPPHLRADLMYVSLERIRMMLDSNTPSASLIRTDEPDGGREKLCIITINPVEVAADNRSATHFLIKPYYELEDRIKAENLVERKEFLEFVFDHEIYHCLDSHLIGPQPMSYLEYWAEYYDFRHENGADAFAIAMHIKRHQAVTAFVRKMKQIRGLSLYCDDCNHWTPQAIQRVAKTDPVNLISMNTMELFRYASMLRDEISPGYETYLLYRSAAKEVCNMLNSNLWSPDEEGKLPSPRPEMVNNMLDIFRNSYLELTGTEYTVEPAR